MTLLALPAVLTTNRYPGRGILLGRSPDGAQAVLAYFIMGRSENSRNRVFVPTEDGIRTQARDPKKMTDPSLVIYRPVRRFQNTTVVTNGDQTDTIFDALSQGKSYRQGLEQRTFEPDPPHYTPRISGLLWGDGSYDLSILKTLDGDPSCCCRQFFSYDRPIPGVGHLLHTYQGDGNPLRSFPGEPVAVRIPDGDPATLAQLLWNSLDRENRVSLFVRMVRQADGTIQDALINQYEKTPDAK